MVYKAYVLKDYHQLCLSSHEPDLSSKLNGSKQNSIQQIYRDL